MEYPTTAVFGSLLAGIGFDGKTMTVEELIFRGEDGIVAVIRIADVGRYRLQLDSMIDESTPRLTAIASRKA